MDAPRIRRALLSVYDKTGLVDFARALHEEFGIELISTGGTAKVLQEAGLPVTLVEQITGSPEMLDGRVKTLHPKIHAAILADRDNPEHLRQLAEQGIEPIDMVVVNLYPFEKTVADPNCTFEQAIEMIDIGGPCLLRAAAKNHKHVLVVCRPGWYRVTLQEMCSGRLCRRAKAIDAFWITTEYDSRILAWLHGLDRPDYVAPEAFLPLMGIGVLRYGENPTQLAHTALISDSPTTLDLNPQSDGCIGGKGFMSYNNYLDGHAALELCAELTRAGPQLAVSTETEPRPKESGDPQNVVWHRPMAGDSAGAEPGGSNPSAGTPTPDHRALPGATLGADSTTPPDHRALPGATLRAGAGLPAGPQLPVSAEAGPRARDSGDTRSPVWHPPVVGAAPGAGATLGAASTATPAQPSDAPARQAPQARSVARRKPLEDEVCFRRNLPHIQRPGATYFVTFRTQQGTLTPAERDRVMECCLFPDGDTLCLHAAVCMPDHVHLVLTPLLAGARAWFSLSKILQDLKSNAGAQIAKLRGRPGPVFQDESFDHIVRNQTDFLECLDYVASNPERARLESAGPYPWRLAEESPGWDRESRAGGVDVEHRWTVQRCGERSWYGLLDSTGRARARAERRSRAPVAGASHEAMTVSTGAEPRPKEPGDAQTTVWHPPVAGDSGGTEPGPSSPTTPDQRTVPGGTRGVCSTPTPEHPPMAGATPGAGATQGLGDTPPCAVCFIKHTNACGVAVGTATSELPGAVQAVRGDTYRRAYLGDPNAAMGGILAVNFPVTAEFAAAVMETYSRWGKPLKDAGHPNPPGAFFLEVWLAPMFTDDAIAVIRGTYDPAAARPEPAEGAFREAVGRGMAVPRKDWGQRVRLLTVGDLRTDPDPRERVYRSIAGGMLVQTRDLLGLNEEQWKVVTQRPPTAAELSDLRLAWLICKHTKSNAITICRDGMLIGNGAGQMSRVMSCRIATWLAQENGHGPALRGAVAASDAFFPFRDGPDLLMEAGVTALIQPGGSKRDDDTIAACNARGAAMIFTGTRHFKH